MRSEPPRPLRTVNRWTLEPIAFLLPALSVALAALIFVGITLASSSLVGLALVVLLVLLVLVPTLAAFRRKW